MHSILVDSLLIPQVKIQILIASMNMQLQGSLKLLVLLLLSSTTIGKHVFLDKYSKEIQDYIMIGYEEGGWSQCDILSEESSYNEKAPQMSMGLKEMKTLNMKLVFASAHCLLVSYNVKKKEDLSTLLEIGRNAINHIRLALILKISSGISLAMPDWNYTNLPFMIAAALDDDKEQFLCPVLGDDKPRLKESMCKTSFSHYKEKLLRIGIVGINPYFMVTENGIDGTDMRLIHLLEKSLSFRAEVIPMNSFSEAVNMVSMSHSLLF